MNNMSGMRKDFVASNLRSQLSRLSYVLGTIEEEEVAILDKDNFKISNLDGKTVFKKPTHINWDIDQAEKAGRRVVPVERAREIIGLKPALVGHNA